MSEKPAKNHFRPVWKAGRLPMNIHVHFFENISHETGLSPEDLLREPAQLSFNLQIKEYGCQFWFSRELLMILRALKKKLLSKNAVFIQQV